MKSHLLMMTCKVSEGGAEDRYQHAVLKVVHTMAVCVYMCSMFTLAPKIGL